MVKICCNYFSLIEAIASSIVILSQFDNSATNSINRHTFV